MRLQSRSRCTVALCCLRAGCCLCCVRAQDDADAEPYFSLTSQRTYLPGEKPEIAVYSHNVKQLEFRVYRVNDPVKFFSQMQELHNFGGRAPQPAEAGAHLAGKVSRLEAPHLGVDSRLHSRAVLARVAPPDSPVARWAKRAAKKQGPKVESYAQVPVLNQQQVVSVWKWTVPLARAVGEPDRHGPGQRQGRVPGRGDQWHAARLHHRRRHRDRDHHQSRAGPADELRGRPPQRRSDRGSAWCGSGSISKKSPPSTTDQQGLLDTTITEAKPENVAVLATQRRPVRHQHARRVEPGQRSRPQLARLHLHRSAGVSARRHGALQDHRSRRRRRAATRIPQDRELQPGAARSADLPDRSGRRP